MVASKLIFLWPGAEPNKVPISMKSFPDCMETYKELMNKGEIQVAYSGLMEFILGLRNHLKNSHPEFYVSGNFYQGYMDFTYFSFTPNSLKKHRLRVAIIFVHKTLEFKVCLGGLNKKAQAIYWEKFIEKGWNKYEIPKSIKGSDFIIESTITTEPDFSNPKDLTNQLEKGILKFAKDVELYISKL
jgi:Family of unknown function (DUF7000)